jgi:hypothetical protein
MDHVYPIDSELKTNMITATPQIVSQSELDLRADFTQADDLGTIGSHEHLRVRLARGSKNLWLAVALDGVEISCVRLGSNSGEVTSVQHWSPSDGAIRIEFATGLGAMRTKLDFRGAATLHCVTSLLPSNDARLSSWPRDVLMAADEGKVFTAQRGLRSGIVFAGSRASEPFSLFYLQNFSALSDYFSVTKRTPADTVGGSWPELGYMPPTGDECVLPKDREFVVSDAYLTFSPEAPTSEEGIAALYLDLFAETYLALDRPAVAYHPWNERAADALRDLTLSPDCTYERQGRRFLMPYVGDEAKPPESMVQYTVAVNVGEYDAWRDEESKLGRLLRDNAGAFFNEELGSIVRWLPGEPFDASQADDNMNHEAMDSWYIHHSLFNLARMAREGNVAAGPLFKASLPYLIRVARRFNYRWPIFFNLKTLDIIRAEAAPGQGGETDVAGMYALVMLHAHEMFGDDEYLQEAEVAIAALHGFGFSLAYQVNTTGFAAEAALRLWKITGQRRHLGLAELCIANIFDNMWLWQCGYGRAEHYRTFFGLFPLRDAPYMAPYEECEAHAKFHEFLALGGKDVRPSLQLLIAEFQKYAVDRCWYYYPDALPVDGIAENPRNGRIERALSVPLEDLQDGFETSGQVGQELYGSGMPFVITARHYMQLPTEGATAFSNYPMYDFSVDDNGIAAWRAAGDPRCTAELRIFIDAPTAEPCAVSVTVRAGDVRVPLRGSISPEGHAVYPFRGGQTIEIDCRHMRGTPDDGCIVIGPLVAKAQT